MNEGAMPGFIHVTVTAYYDRHPQDGRSLAWIAPELNDAQLTIIDDRINDPTPSRAWEGTLDGPTFARFARAWHLPDDGTEEASTAAKGADNAAPRRYTLDGMNWEVHGESPIVCVSVQVTRLPGTNKATPPVRVPM
jgi:hypothetical protein